ncbi:hypothetical protein G4B88_012632, partial [Cannabis sativa]
MYGCNLFMWKKTRINYNFIFEFSPTTALKYRDAFLICTTFMTAVVAAMVLHLILRASGFSPSQVDAIPGLLLMITLLRHMESTACYFRAGSLRKHQFETCHSGRLFSELAYGLNVVLRVIWVETVMGFRIGVVESRLVDFLLASL